MAGNRYGVVFCGGGPAATGVLVAAAAEGRLDELLSRRVCFLERGALLGPGALGHYPITGNTRSSTFLRAFETEASHRAFDSVRTDPSTGELDRLRDEFPPLPLVGRHLASLGRAVQSLVQATPGSAVLTNRSVRELWLLAGGGVEVVAESAPDGQVTTVAGDQAVLAMGGRPRTGWAELSLLPGLDLAPYADKVCHADDLIDDRVGLRPDLRRAVTGTGEVVVVGGSHSAWSAAWLLDQDPELRDAEGRPPRVTVLHRGRLRIFFGSAAEARAADYAFDPDDVCPVTGVVHRHGGLRADARDLAWAATHDRQGAGPVRAIDLLDNGTSTAAVQEALHGAGAVVAAVGYEPCLPTVRRPDGREVRLGYDEGGARVTARAQLVTEDGTVLPELLALGLGAGQPAVGELAGEPSFTGRIDAVRLYQAEVGRIVLEALLGPRHS